MKFAADLHIHSKYARACSKRINPETLSAQGDMKGIKVLGTGDFTHPLWLAELEDSLEPAEQGLFKVKKREDKTRFLLSSEISCIYSKLGKTRKIHIVVLAPSFKSVKAINKRLGLITNLKADGRPILGLDAKKFVEIIFNICPDCFVIPAHIWTPWFSLFGSRSGFNSIEECFEEYTDRIYALETGLSSDPKMNWRISELDKLALVSNSDAHSPEKIGREANFFDTDFSYKGIIEAIKSKNPKKFLFTIEFFPEEGKYHYDGHKNCGVSYSPKQTEKYGGTCPVCGKKLTIGVLHRVEELADRPENFKPKGAVPYKSLIPLQEIIAEAINVGVKTKTAKKEYDKLINLFENELNVLLFVGKQELVKATLPKIAQGIIRVRKGNVSITPGYDGVYGKIKIFNKEETEKPFSGQNTLFA